MQFWPEIAGDYNRSCGLHLQEQDAATFLNVAYSYFISHPNELRHEVRDNFEEFLEDIPESMQKNRQTDDRPIAEQALGMMDQLKEFEEMMGTTTFGARSLGTVEDGPVSQPPAPVIAPPPTTPAFPSIELD